MAQNEQGHAVNYGNFTELISAATSMGATFNPGYAAIKPAALNAKKAAAASAIAAVDAALALWQGSIIARRNAYDLLKPLAIRACAHLEGSNADPLIIKNARTLKNRILGRRANKLSAPGTAQPAEPPQPGAEAATTISVSQQSFDQLKARLDSLVALIATVPLYMPNEADLKVTAMQAYSSNLGVLNTAVDTNALSLFTKRQVRNKELYDKNTGLVALSRFVKCYVKSVLTVRSPVYRQLNRIHFRTPALL